MEYQISDSYDEDVARQAANLHIESLGYRSFITLFGETFLARLYRAILIEKNGFFVVAQERSRVKGFVFGLMDSGKLNGAILRRFPDFVFLIIKMIIVRPLLIKKLFETMMYTKKKGHGAQAELMVMAVDASMRSQGIGQEMLQRLEDEFKKRGIDQYQVTVHKAMERSIHFYQKNGLKFQSTFKLYNYDWNVYQKWI